MNKRVRLSGKKRMYFTPPGERQYRIISLNLTSSPARAKRFFKSIFSRQTLILSRIRAHARRRKSVPAGRLTFESRQKSTIEKKGVNELECHEVKRPEKALQC